MGDIEKLLQQVKNAILSKPTPPLTPSEDENFRRLEEAVDYLCTCLGESGVFLRELSKGALDATPPGRHNFLAAPLKELHSGLLHLTWQAEQVTKGDYHQRVAFLGEFSTAFNTMVLQLEEREKKLQDKAASMERSQKLMTAVMDGVQDWIVVMGEQGNLIYQNQAAQNHLCALSGTPLCQGGCQLLAGLAAYKGEPKEHQWEHDCAGRDRISHVTSFLVDWGGQEAYAHLIADLTDLRYREERLESLAYRDELTGLYNRRYCLRVLEELQNRKEAFALCFVDVDQLKMVNDQLGHSTGDVYIRHVAQVLQRGMRTSDLVCRMGGDEFVLLIHGCSAPDAEKKLSLLREDLLAHKGEFPMSISYGIIEVGAQNTISPSSLLKRADGLMYEFKKATQQTRESL